MNIFEYLGLSKYHRKEDKVTQLVKHWNEVVDKNKVGKHHVVQVKKDGVCSLTIIYDGTVSIFSRTGKMFTNTKEILSNIVVMKLPDGVYMGELWVPKSVCSLEQLSGLVNPNRVKPISDELKHVPSQMIMSWFDRIDIYSFTIGSSSLPYKERHNNLELMVDKARQAARESSQKVEVLPYTSTLVAWPPTLEAVTKAVHAAADLAIGGSATGYGEEGIVIRDLNAGWEAGHKGWRTMKIVRGVDYDLLCIGWEEGTGKYKGKVANLIFEWKGGKTIKCMLGRGWTHADAEEMFVCATAISKFGNPIGKVFQVYALEESSKGKLRLPKVGELRHDKNVADV